MATLYRLIGAEIERELDAEAALSVIECAILTALSRESRQHLDLPRLAGAVALTHDETAKLVAGLGARRLLTPVLCSYDGGGTCIELTKSGRRLERQARSVHDRTLGRVVREAKRRPELARLVTVLQDAGLLSPRTAG